MKLKTAQELIKTKIEANPKVYGKDKAMCLSEMLASDNITAITVKTILTLDRAWRKVLADNPSLDYRKDTTPSEKAVKNELGYMS